MLELNAWIAWVRVEGLRVVYITMGSMQVLEEFQVQALYNGLNQVEGCAVLWSLKEDQQIFLPGGGVQGLPKKFFINKWLPQAEALQLPEVAVVVTHCGWGGMNETITAGKPIVATPFRGDQPLNAKVAKARGLCEILNTSKLGMAAVTEAVSKVLGDPSYAACAKELQRVLLRTGGAERCAEVAEQVVCGCDELVSQPPTLSTALQSKAMPLLFMLLGATTLFLAQRGRAARSAR